MTTAPGGRPTATPRNPRAVLRGLAAVAALFAGAVDALVTAWLGIPRLGWLARRAASVTADEYRRSAWGAIADAEVISDTPGYSQEGQHGGQIHVKTYP